MFQNSPELSQMTFFCFPKISGKVETLKIDLPPLYLGEKLLENHFRIRHGYSLARLFVAPNLIFATHDKPLN